jgi:hypothetical protein
MREHGTHPPTNLASGIDVGQGINIGPGKFGKKNKHRALNIHVLNSVRLKNIKNSIRFFV